MSYKIAYDYVKNNNMIYEDTHQIGRKLIILSELQHISGGIKYFNFKNEGVIFMDNYCDLSKNRLCILKELSRLCNLDVTSMKKQDILNQLENYVVFLE
jgi:hypothetical protein